MQGAACRKLAMLHSANACPTCNLRRGTRLEKLGGDRAGQYSIRINERWRICFEWQGKDAINVEIVDYRLRCGMENKIAPVHPGEVLLEEFAKDPGGVSQNRLAQHMGITTSRLNDIVRGRRGISRRQCSPAGAGDKYDARILAEPASV